MTELIVTPDMSTRKKTMLDMADAFIALPGGIGTLDEMTEAITANAIGSICKPCIFCDKNGYYKPMKEMLELMADKGFIGKKVLESVLFSEEMGEIERFISNTLM